MSAGSDIVRIESQKHPAIQTLRELQTDRGRQQHNAFQAEGPMVVERALRYGVRVAFLICSDGFASSPESRQLLADAHRSGVETFEISPGLMAKTVPGKPPPAVVACVERVLHVADGLLELNDPLLFLVDRCENPDNLGMLLRSLDAAGVGGVVLTSDGADPFSRLCVRASRGSVLSLNLSVTADPEGWLLRAKERAFRVVATSAHGSESLWSADLTGPVVIVVGNEHEGVRSSIREIADSVLAIPMAGKMESLNIAVAAAVVAYEAVRQRMHVGRPGPRQL